MLPQAALIALVSAALFGGLVMIADRKRGTVIAQALLALAGALVFVAIVAAGPVAGVAPRDLAAFAIGMLSAAAAAILYFLYVGRFERVWVARGVFALVYLAASALFGLVFLSLL